MKYLFCFLCLLGPNVVFGFGTYGDQVQTLDKKIQIETWEDRAKVVVTETIKNDAAQTLSFSYLWPTFGAQQSPKLYWQSEGQTVQALPLAQAAEAAFSQAAAAQKPIWLGVTSQPYDAWWQVEGLSLRPGETGELKYELALSLGFFENFHLGQIYLEDGRTWQNFEVSLVRAGPPQQLWLQPGEWQWEKGPEALAGQWQAPNFLAAEPLRYFTSDLATATLRYPYAGQAYEASFRVPLQTDFDRVIVVLDHSGSVYGPRWERLKEAFKTLIEQAPENTQFKVALSGTTWQWLNEDWRQNSRTEQQQWIETLEGTDAQGRSDTSRLLDELELLQAGADERVALVLLGDWSEVEPETLRPLATAEWRVLMIDFWQKQSSQWQAWWQRFGAEYVPLFNSGFELVEIDLINAAWQRLGRRWPEAQKIKKDQTELFEPKILTSDLASWAVQQRTASSDSSILADMVPRWWAARKIADYLRQYQRQSLLEAPVQSAIMSIAHTFGVAPAGVLGTASPEVLMTALAALSRAEQWAEITRLESGATDATDIRWWQATPFYQTDNTWQRLGWETYPRRGDTPIIKQWSLAHKALFLAHPQLLAQPFSWGAVALCQHQRCATISPNEGRTEPAKIDALLWDAQAPSHWATNYWADLVWAGVVDPALSEPQQWAATISRGQFVDWLVGFMAPEALLPKVDTAIFSDLDLAGTGAAEALWLHNKGLFKGYDDGTARLNQPLKRIEALKLLMRVQGFDTRHVLGNFDPKGAFTDLNGWTQPWGQAAYDVGLVQGYNDGTFRPFQPLTQAEAFKLLVESEKLTP